MTRAASSTSRQLAVARIVQSMGVLMILLGFLILHDAVLPEDSTTIWVCSVQGNQQCGPDTPPIQFAPSNAFRNWDAVVRYYWVSLSDD